MISEKERHQLLVEWNQTSAEFPRHCLHQLIETQAERNPLRIAYKWNRRQWTLREINDRANTLARQLTEQGIGPGDAIPVLMERSAEVPVCFLAIMKAGAAFVPVDPYWPDERINNIISRLESKAVLVGNMQKKQETPTERWMTVNIDQLTETPENPQCKISSSDPVYIHFTSGTTGIPKGAINQHQGIVNRLIYMNKRFGSDPDQVIMQTSYPVFDTAVWQLFWPLLYGGRCIIPCHTRGFDVEEILGLTEQEQVEILDFTPSVLEMLMRIMTDQPERCSQLRSVRYLIIGGEAIRPATIRWFQSEFPHIRIINAYGPAETSIGVVFHEIPRGFSGNIPIGRPIDNVQILILDPMMQPVPVGAPGELYIGGICVGLGYWRSEEETQHAFVPNPFPEIEGDRLYRTRDRARYRTDGRIEFLGRTDTQFKIRGIRIEPGEIETILRQFPGVQEAVVQSCPHENYHILAAYLVAGSPDTDSPDADSPDSMIRDKPDDETIRAFLKTRLPDSMIPDAYIWMESIPVTSAGKIDTKHLPIPDLKQNLHIWKSPQSETEQIVSTIWKEVLEAEQVGRNDNFFYLGGHSLLATQAISRIRDRLSVDVSLKQLFELPGLVEFCSHLDTLNRDSQTALSLPVPSLQRTGDLPLSSAQQRLWFLDQFEGKTAIYNIASQLSLDGKLNTDLLEKTLNEIICRHETLRANFHSADGQARMVVRPFTPYRLLVTDVSSLPRAERENAIDQHTREVAETPFDLESDELFRFRLLRTGGQSYLLLMAMHHIISDGWSYNVFRKEMTVIYQALLNNQPSPLAPLPVQYADFAAWQHSHFQGQQMENHLRFWQEHLAGAPPLMELPYKHRRLPEQTFQGRQYHFQIDADRLRGLHNLGQQFETTLFMTLVSAFAVLLSRYNHQEDLVIGVPVANRNHGTSEGLIGFLVNTLALRIRPRAGLSFADLLRQVRQTATDAYDHQYLPFDQLVEVLQPERNLSYAPIFQVMFALQNAPKTNLDLPGIRAAFRDIDTGTAKFDLTLYLEETGTGLEGYWEYNTDLFDQTFIRQITAHFHAVIQAMLDDSHQPVTAFPLVTETERRQIIEDWNAYTIPIPEMCIHQQFEAQVKQTPQAIAASCYDREWSYETLNRRANRLAYHLQKIGVGTETLVGICMDRSLEMLAAVLAILKAGGAYVPLDPEYPQERLRFMLEDSQASILLIQKKWGHGPAPDLARVIYIDPEGAIEGEDDMRDILASEIPDYDTNPVSNVHPRNLAYVIYTSGSTGRPKGVSIEHRSVVALTTWSLACFSREQLAGVLASTSICFDLSVFEMFLPLGMGGKVILVHNILHLPDLPPSQEVTLINTVPSAMEALCKAEIVPDSVRVVNLAGEALKSHVVKRVYNIPTIQHVYNLYGPSEDTVYSTFALMDPRDTAPPTIGRPIANTRLYVLDAQMHPVPTGVIGELYIGGAGLSRGYWNRPELNKERFVPNPFGPPDSRLYRTGDWVRYLRDARIDFLGRIDHQVKIRGFRIELGEIESVLQQHPDVEENVVVVREEASGHKQLTAYVVGKIKDAESLRRRLSQHLPEYMVPAFIEVLETMPRTPNGKIDRKALPDPKKPVAPGDSHPRTPEERKLSDIWCELLGYDEIGIHQNFFELGGDSILSLQFIARAYRAGLKLRPRQVFQHQTIAAMAEVAEAVEETKSLASGPLYSAEHKTGSVEDIYPLSPMQEGMMFHSLTAPGSGIYIEQMSATYQGELRIEFLKQAWRQVVQRHPILRTAFEEGDNQKSRQVVYRSVTFPWFEHDWRNLSGVEQSGKLETFLQEDRTREVVWDRAPLMRFNVIRLKDDAFHFVLNFHHALLDGWSLHLLYQEVWTIYEGLLDGREVSLPPTPPYRRFIDWLGIRNMDEAEVFWREHLHGVEQPTPIGIERSPEKESADTEQFRQQDYYLSASLTEKIGDFAKTHHLTMNTLVQGAWALVLSRYGRNADIVFGVTVSGRPPQLFDMESMVGLFINTLPARVKVDNEASLVHWLRGLRDRQAEMEEYAYTPLARIQGWSNLPQGQALFDSIIAFENYPVEQSLGTGNKYGKPENVQCYEQTHFPLTLMAEPGQSLFFKLNYSSHRFDDLAVHRMLRHLEQVLTVMIDRPDQRLHEISLLTPAEHYQIVMEWNQTRQDFSCSCLHQLFEAQAERTPEAVAVIDGESSVTYRQLNYQANQLAHYLLPLGIGQDVLAGVCMERSSDMLAAILAILKAGGAYLPLDPDYPEERLALMLEDAHAPVVVTQCSLRDRFAGTTPRILCLDEEAGKIRSMVSENPVTTVTPTALAYVLYTSGSTGRPKGVAIEHRSAVTLVHWSHGVFQPEQIAGVLASTSVCFDLSVFEIFVPLSCGGTVIMAENALQLPQLPAADQVTLINTVPSAIRELLRMQGIPSSVITVNLAGEPLRNHLVQAVYQESSADQVYNLYGPSEDTTYSTFTHIPKGSTLPVHIGRPVANTQVYILDPAFQPAPVGVAGELYLGGDGLAREYYNRPELTSQVFIPNPFGNESTRLYKTGDLARYLPDGNIEFLGRMDHQVKLRGFRIELGETETALMGHPGVESALVMAREDQPGHPQLVAYVVPDKRYRTSEIKGEDTHAAQILGQWETLWEDTYQDLAPGSQPGLNLAGWTDSYTGSPIPEPEMLEWIRGTVDRVLAWNPRKVLEIGCGTGLLLFRIAPLCEEYVGTDISREVLNYIERQFNFQGTPPDHVTLLHQDASEWKTLPVTQKFDTIIFNSVVQYFPDIDYLAEVLEQAVMHLEQGGKIFIGDVRNRSLLRMFHCSLELYQVEADITRDAFLQQVHCKMLQEGELVIEPEFFKVLPHHLSFIRHVEIQPRRGRFHNEMTRFRYDVVLHGGEVKEPVSEPEWHEWSGESWSLASTEEFLQTHSPSWLGFRNVPNARLMQERKLMEFFDQENTWSETGQLREYLEQLSPGGGIEPEDWFALAEDLPYQVHLHETGDGMGTYDVMFQSGSGNKPNEKSETLPRFWRPSGFRTSWASYANQPQQWALNWQLIPELRQHLRKQLPTYMIPSHFVLLETFPLTPNGKINRRALPLPNQFERDLHTPYDPPRTPAEKALASAWSAILGIEKMGIHDDFFALGGDSIIALQIIVRLRQQGWNLPHKRLFQTPTIAELASYAEVSDSAEGSQVEETGPAGLTPIQCWFFERNLPNPHHFNQSVLLEVPADINRDFMAQAIRNVILHHDALQLQYCPEGHEWKPFKASLKEEVLFHVTDFSEYAPGNYSQHIERVAEEYQASLNLTDGPIMRMVLFDLGPHRPHRLLWVIHHMAVDGVSWRILLGDLWTAYDQLCQGDSVQLPPGTTSFQGWTRRLKAYAQSEILRGEAIYWTELADDSFAPLPTDTEDANIPDTQDAEVELSSELDTEATLSLLQDLPRVYNTQINDALLTALGLTLADWTGDRRFLIDLEGHGREDLFEMLDLSRTVGWFTSLFPVRLEIETDPLEALKSVKEQLRNIPCRGIGFGVLGYLCEDPLLTRKLRELPRREVVFNYLGQWGRESMLPGVRWAGEAHGPEVDGMTIRSHLLQVNGSVIDGRLRMTWGYNRRLHHPQTIEKLANGFLEHLHSLIHLCRSRKTWGYTPSDFPLAAPQQTELDHLVEKYHTLPAVKNVEAIYPLSPLQQGFLYHTLAEPGSGIYFEQEVYHLQGTIHPDCLKQAWEQVVRRHAILRTAFEWENLPHPLQVVLSEASQSWNYQDWRVMTEEEREHRLEQFLEEDRRQGFELNQPPLMRMNFLHWTENSYRLIWSFHHILLDGWSFTILHNEMFQIYDALIREQEFVLPSPSSYLDYIAWLDRQDRPRAAGFWKRLLDGFQNPLILARSSKETSLFQGRNSASEKVLSRSLSGNLRQFAKRYHLTLNTVLQGVWTLLLRRHTHAEDIVFGSVVATRSPDIPGIESMVGLCINNIPIRIHFQPHTTALSLMQQIHDHQSDQESFWLPLFEIQQETDVRCDQSLFDSVFVFENFPIDSEFQKQSQDFSIVKSQHWGHIHYPLTLIVIPNSEILLDLKFDQRRVEPATVDQILEDFKKLSEQMMHHLQQPVRFWDSLPERPLFPQPWAMTSANPENTLFSQPRAVTTPFTPPRTEVEKELAEMWKDILKKEQVGIYDHFLQVGGHSLLLVELLGKIKKRLCPDFSLRDLLGNFTIAGIAHRIESAISQAENLVDLEQEAILDVETTSQAAQLPVKSDPENILLTGTTGFIGAFLLKELLEQTNARIYCMVRAHDLSAAKQRLRENLEHYQLWQDHQETRIIPLLGDLALPRFGWEPERFLELGMVFDCICHNGALVHFAMPYETAKAPNVEGTREILWLAVQGRLKPVHYISTLGVLTDPWQEDNDIEDIRHSATQGYTASKWVAEKLVKTAAERGIPAHIYRLGLITGSSQTGACKPGDFFHRVLIGCAQIGYAPEEALDREQNLTPADFAAKAVVALARQTLAPGRVFHLNNSRSVSYREIFQHLADFGCPVQTVPYALWLGHIEKWNNDHPDSPFKPILPILQEGMDVLGDRPRPGNFLSRTHQELASLGIHCPVPDRQWLEKSFSFLRKHGCL